MKIKNQLPMFNERFHKELFENGWVPLKEPRNVTLAILLSIPFMIINALISMGVFMIFSTLRLKEFGLQTHSFTIALHLADLLLVVLLVILHEFLHLIFIPNFFKSEKNSLGLHGLVVM